MINSIHVEHKRVNSIHVERKDDGTHYSWKSSQFSKEKGKGNYLLEEMIDDALFSLIQGEDETESAFEKRAQQEARSRGIKHVQGLDD
ncbi:hypothetical protein A2442_01030 [Candidatus Campbellbacteria bacterium RIFOXYC2_FULL_35_25]|uniref:Uncharacterized protein n=1 Tax=Candidatus Campbellbacteria bacterium RIFOXYC2_FULL_35_25 TaxID=1797582 RepID=A0A1F5EIZ2_9BACT|nr:MAG: hypothetical protein A2442_01030 [Candidatus Campbellbacteria bacterium RIFOXYC2_FULL_35_25]